MRLTSSFILLLSLISGSCAFTAQQVSFNPEIQMDTAKLANGHQVTVITVDERTRSVIGSRGVGGMGASITAKEDVAEAVNGTVVNGLRRKGFDIKTNPDRSTELRVEVRNLEYTVTPGIFTGTLRTEAALKAVCTVNKNREYERLYRAEQSDDIIVVQFAETNEKRINEALSKVIQSLLDDPQLMNCLMK